MAELALLRTRRFGPFFWAQFLGALNDNVFRNALAIFLAFGTLGGVSLTADTLVNLSAALFTAPFVLFSTTAGQLADKWDKARVIRVVKAAEVAIMSFAAVGFQLRSAPLLLVALFLMGTHSAFFGPVKFSILPQHLRDDELVGGNALVQTGTFAAILAGTVVGGALAGIPAAGPSAVSALVVALALVGLLAGLGVPPAPPPDPSLRIDWNPLPETLRTIGFARRDRSVFLSIIAISWFWSYGTVLLVQFPGLGHQVLGGNERLVAVLLTVFSVGVGLGCTLCDRLSAGRLEPGIVPLGAIGLSLFALDLYGLLRAWPAAAVPIGPGAFLALGGSWRLLADLVLVGVSGGLFIVPLQTLVQQRSLVTHRARIIAGGNILSSLSMTLAAAGVIVLRQAGLTIPDLLLVVAVLNVLVALWLCAAVPEFPARSLAWARGRG